eukprot:5260549-Pleurochrysis_carterae.AAC.1
MRVRSVGVLCEHVVCVRVRPFEPASARAFVRLRARSCVRTRLAEQLSSMASDFARGCVRQIRKNKMVRTQPHPHLRVLSSAFARPCRRLSRRSLRRRCGHCTDRVYASVVRRRNQRAKTTLLVQRAPCLACTSDVCK